MRATLFMNISIGIHRRKEQTDAWRGKTIDVIFASLLPKLMRRVEWGLRPNAMVSSGANGSRPKERRDHQLRGRSRICSQRFFSRGQQSQIRRERSTKKRLSSMAQESSAARGKYLPCVRAMIVQIQSLSDTALLRENERGIMACIADILPVTIRRISVFQVFVAQPTAIKNRASTRRGGGRREEGGSIRPSSVRPS